ncbi:MAG: 4Fe-4S binding protein [Candidatus Sumerlaeia bacterium]
MKIAIASGKGGSGKTTLSVALALAAQQPLTLLDCDVEEPNAQLFLNAGIEKSGDYNVLVPEIIEEQCVACGKCGEICEFNAIVSFGSTAMVFPELCHSCGGCKLVCSYAAIREVPRKIGIIEEGQRDHIHFIHGSLEVGVAMSPPLIREVKRRAALADLQLIDCPPGTACPMVSAVQDADYVILVTEPTPFGLHDLTLTVDTLRPMQKRFGVVINRAGTGDDRVNAYCAREEIPILLEIPDSRAVAEAYSRGENLIDAMPEIEAKLQDLLAALIRTQEGVAS